MPFLNLTHDMINHFVATTLEWIQMQPDFLTISVLLPNTAKFIAQLQCNAIVCNNK